MSENEIKKPGEQESKKKSAPAPAKKTPSGGKHGGLSRKSKHRITSVVLTALVLAGVIILNVIASVLTERFSAMTADITANGSYNLTEQTEKVVTSLKKKVTIYFLMDRKTFESFDNYYKQLTNLVDNMVRDSGGMLSVEYVDIVSQPNFVNDYSDENRQTSDVIVKCGKKYNVLHKEDLFNFELMNQQYQYITSSKAESAIDTAIVKVTSDRSDKIVIVTDHTEENNSGYLYLSKVLTANNYEPVTLQIESGEIPDNVNTVICYAPTADYNEKAVEKLRGFLYNDGKYGKSMIYISYRNQIKSPNIDKLLDEYGMLVSDGLAFDMDTSRQMSGASSYSAYRYIAASFRSKMYTDNITKDDQTVLADYSRGIIAKNENITESLVSYSSKSGICPFDAGDDWNPDDYILGNVSVLMQGISGNDESMSKLIVSGSTEMWNETIMQSQFVNQTYWLNIVDTLNHREDNTIRLEDKVITDYSLQGISRQTSVITGVMLFAVLPVLIIGAGIMVFVVRRRK